MQESSRKASIHAGCRRFAGPTTDLSGVTLFHTNGIAPTDLDVYVAATVPEPATWALMVAGAGLLDAWMRRRTNKAR